MSTQKELNLRQRRLWELLKDYDMGVLYHPVKANVAADALSRMTMGSVSHVEEAKKDLLNDVHSLARLSVRVADSPNGCIMVHHNFESSFLVEVKFKQHLKLNASFSMEGWCIEVSWRVMCSQCRLFEELDP